MPNTKPVGVAYSDPELVAGTTITGATVTSPTIASPTITGGTITGAVITSPTIAGTVTSTAASVTTVSNSSTGSSDAAAVSTTLTMTGAGGVGWATKSTLTANVALGAYANGLYGYLEFGASGRVTGLASGTLGEIVMSAACTQGTYAAFEAELGFPSGAKTGTNTSFFYLSTYGADKAEFDTSGTLFNLAGVTKGSGNFLQDTTSGSAARPTSVIKVITPDGTRFLPLYSTAACGA